MTASLETDMGAALLRADGIRNPYPIYDRLREQGPVVWSDALGMWLATSHATVREVYRSFERFSSSARRSAQLASLPTAIREQVPTLVAAESAAVLNVADPPVHTRHRRLVNPPLTPRRLAPKHEWVESVCDSLATSMSTLDEPDLLADFAAPLSFTVILSLFGSPLEHVPVYQAASETFFAFCSIGGRTRENALLYERALVELRSALESVYTSLDGRDPEETVIGSLLNPAPPDKRPDDLELFVLLRKFFAAGHENLIYTLGIAILELLRRPEQLDLVRNDPALASPAYEEAIRWEAPNQGNARVVAADTVFAGRELRAGETVMALKAAAGRDPSAWTNPNDFDITRDQNEPEGGTVAFGQGIHFCVGAGLARLAGPIALTTLLHRFPNMRLVNEWTPAWAQVPLRRKLTALPVRLN